MPKIININYEFSLLEILPIVCIIFSIIKLDNVLGNYE